MTSRDYNYIANRYVSVKDETASCGELSWFERKDITKETPTECLICIEAETEMFTKYAHPKAHSEATIEAAKIAEEIVSNHKEYVKEYIEYYTFYYGKEYNRLYSFLYKKYKEEYYAMLLAKKYEFEELCDYHSESCCYHCEFSSKN